MKRTIHIGVLVSLLLGTAVNPGSVLAVGETQQNLMIAEVSPEAADSATKEHVLIYNPGAVAVDVSGWLVQYRSASYKPDDTKGWSTRAILGCQSTKQSDCPSPHETAVAAGETLKLSSYETGEGILPLASGMATAGGAMRLLQPIDPASQPHVHDKVGYGSAADFEGEAAAPAPKAGRGVVRIQDEQGVYVDTDHNKADFILVPVEEEIEESGPVQPETEAPGQGAGLATYLDAEVSEVMPDPPSPQTDSADEFIELYNPHDRPLNLAGYVIKTGANWNYKYTLTDIALAPYEYLTLSAAQTHLTLSNAGSGVRLYDPAGALLFEVPSYGKAKSGHSWVRDAGGQWVWTARVTPDAQNIVEAPVIAGPAKASSAGSKKPATKATSTKKPATPKTSAVKGISTPVAQPAQTAGAGGNQTGMWVLAAACALGLGYALFEYRQDIGGFVRRQWERLASFGRK